MRASADAKSSGKDSTSAWASAARSIKPTAALTQLTAKSALLQADSAARLKVRGMTVAADISLVSGTSCSDHPLAVAGLDCHCSQKVRRRLVAKSKGSGINLSADALICRARELTKRPANAEIEIIHMKLWNPLCIPSVLLSPDTAKLKSSKVLLKRQHNVSPWPVFRRAVMSCIGSQNFAWRLECSLQAFKERRAQGQCQLSTEQIHEAVLMGAMLLKSYLSWQRLCEGGLPARTASLEGTGLKARQAPMMREAGVITGCLLSEAWKMVTHNLSSSNCLCEGQALLDPAKALFLWSQISAFLGKSRRE